MRRPSISGSSASIARRQIEVGSGPFAGQVLRAPPDVAAAVDDAGAGDADARCQGARRAWSRRATKPVQHRDQVLDEALAALALAAVPPDVALPTPRAAERSGLRPIRVLDGADAQLGAADIDGQHRVVALQALRLEEMEARR